MHILYVPFLNQRAYSALKIVPVNIFLGGGGGQVKYVHSFGVIEQLI